jgi:LysR family transcriptional regulator, transcriptional activator of the cysJI operon
MYLDSFKVFCDLVESGGFAKAATVNGITQSAVSQQVRNLERQLNCTLLERSRRGVSLTPEGAEFHKACMTIRGVWGDFEDRLRLLKNEVAGELRIASIYSIGLHELPPRLKAFREKFPQVDVKIEYRRSPQVYEMVESGAADVGLVAYPMKRPKLICEVFDEDRLILICHPKHRLASRKTVRLSELKDERFISFEPDTPTRKVIDRSLREAGVEVVHAAEFDNIETVKRAVEIESGISVVPSNTVTQEVKNGQLVPVTIESPRMSRPLGLIFSRSRARPPGMKELIAALKEA